jgi:hypothetical protein
MRGASTLLPYESEISFPVQERVEFGRLGELDLVDPAGTLGVFIDKFGLAGQCFVYTKNFAAYGRIEVACSLDRLDNADRAAFLHLRADVREFNSGHVAELFLSVVCYSNRSDAVLDDDVLVILAVSNLHDRYWTFAPKVVTMPSSSRKDIPSKQLKVGLSKLSSVPTLVSESAANGRPDGDGNELARVSAIAPQNAEFIHEFFPGSFLAHWLAPEGDIRRLLEQNEIAADTLVA